MPALTTNEEIADACRRNHIPLVGVYYKDLLPRNIVPGGYVINMADSTDGEGTHWVCIWIEKEKTTMEAVYFDSFGLAPPESVKLFLRPIAPQIVYNTNQIQSIDTGICGYYCLFFLYYMSHMKGCVPNIYRRFACFADKLFSTDPVKNRRILTKYLEPLR